MPQTTSTRDPRRHRAVRALLARTLGPTPEETRARRLDILEGVRRLVGGDEAPLPAWVADLIEAVESDAL